MPRAAFEPYPTSSFDLSRTLLVSFSDRSVSFLRVMFRQVPASFAFFFPATVEASQAGRVVSPNCVVLARKLLVSRVVGGLEKIFT